MSPDDPRHGRQSGYLAGCRADCCRHAHMVWMKRYRMSAPRSIDAIGSHRRVQALEAIGWTRADISKELGHKRDYIKHVLAADVIFTRTAEAIENVYEQLSETVPQDAPTRRAGQWRKHETTRERARKAGYPPPSAWFGVDIDDPEAEPDPGWREYRRPITALLEDFDWLVGNGESEHMAATQLGVTLDAVQVARRRLERAS